MKAEVYAESKTETSWKESRRRRKLGREKHAKKDRQLEERSQMSYSESRGKEGTGAGGGGREGWNAGGENMAEICMRLRNWAMRGQVSAIKYLCIGMISDLESESEVVMNSTLEIVDIAKERRGSMVCGHRTSTRAQG